MPRDPFLGFSAPALRRAAAVTLWFRDELAKHAVARARDNRPQSVTEQDVDDAVNVILLVPSLAPAQPRGAWLKSAAAGLAFLAVGAIGGPLVDDTAEKSTMWWVALVIFAVSSALWVGLAIGSRPDRQ